MSRTATLFHLQTLDRQAALARQRLGEIETLLGQDEAVQVAQAHFAQAQATLRHWKTRVSDLELERATLSAEADAAERRLYSGQVHNPRELMELRDKVQELRRRHTALEDPLLEAMLEADESQSVLSGAQTALDEALAIQEAAQSQLIAEQTNLQNQLATLETQIAQTRSSIATELVESYDSLSRRLGGVAVAEVKSEECQACGVRINSSLVQQARHGEIRHCPTCGRILYVP